MSLPPHQSHSLAILNLACFFFFILPLSHYKKPLRNLPYINVQNNNNDLDILISLQTLFQNTKRKKKKPGVFC